MNTSPDVPKILQSPFTLILSQSIEYRSDKINGDVTKYENSPSPTALLHPPPQQFAVNGRFVGGTVVILVSVVGWGGTVDITETDLPVADELTNGPWL